MNITIISGSPRTNSNTIRIARFLEKELSVKTSHETDVIDVRDYNLPLLQETYIKEEKTPDELKPLRNRMFKADAFVLLTPEYNGSYTPAMKALLDFFAKDAFYRKPMAIVTASNGGLGGIRAAMQMQQLICAIFGVPSPHMLIIPFMDKKFDAEGNLLDESFQKSIDVFSNEFIWLAEKLC